MNKFTSSQTLQIALASQAGALQAHLQLLQARTEAIMVHAPGDVNLAQEQIINHETAVRLTKELDKVMVDLGRLKIWAK